jgi:predicted nuclease with RNAse H fold
MAIQTMDDAQSKADRRVDKSFKKKKKRIPLSEESLADLHQRGASLAEQLEWLELKKKQKDKYER